MRFLSFFRLPHRAMLLGLGLAATAPLLIAAPVAAQPIGYYPPFWARPFGPPMYPPRPIPAPDMPMPPGEVRMMLEDFGFSDVTRLVRRDDVYEAAAVDRNGFAVLVRLDAYDGDILGVRRDFSDRRPPAERPKMLDVPKNAAPRQIQPPARPGNLAAAKPPAGAIPAPAANYPPALPDALKRVPTPARPSLPPQQGFD